MNKNVGKTNSLHPPSGHKSSIQMNCSLFYDDIENALQVKYEYSYFLKLTRSLYQGICDADLQDIAQEAWISYLRRSEKVDIDKPESYITMVIRNKFNDYIRKEKRRYPFPTIPLSLLTENPEVEFVSLSSRFLVSPVNEIDDLIESMDILNDLAVVLPKIPPRQRRAIICTLFDKVDDPSKLQQVLVSNHIDASEMSWPSNSAEKHLLQASLPAARRALALLLKIDLCQFKQRKRVSD